MAQETREWMEETFGEDVDIEFTTTVTRSSDEDFARGLMRDKWEAKLDEPEGIPEGPGTDDHPAPFDHVVLALVGCQVEVLTQALIKARIEDYEVEATGRIDEPVLDDVPDAMPTNTGLRIGHVDIDLSVSVPEEYEGRAQRCLDVYDQGCAVGQSLIAGIDYTPHTSLEVKGE